MELWSGLGWLYSKAPCVHVLKYYRPAHTRRHAMLTDKVSLWFELLLVFEITLLRHEVTQNVSKIRTTDYNSAYKELQKQKENEKKYVAKGEQLTDNLTINKGDVQNVPLEII